MLHPRLSALTGWRSTVGRQIGLADEATVFLHVVDEDIAERSLIERCLALRCGIAQRLRTLGLHHAITNPELSPFGS